METEAVNKVIEIEEGEIENDDDEQEDQDNVEIYIPLERPHIPGVQNRSPPSDNEDNLLNDTSSDTDSSTDDHGTSKNRKKKILPLKKEQLNVAPPRKKSYNIWCNELQTEVLSNNFRDCDVDQTKDKTRDVESYDYKMRTLHVDDGFYRNRTIKPHFPGKPQYTGKPQFTGKRNYEGSQIHDQRKSKKVVPKKNQKTATTKGVTRSILELTATVNDSDGDIAKDVANKLCEEKEDLVLRAVNILGKEAVISLFEETRKIEEDGGMLIMNGVRRRTPGGVFFYLLKTSSTLPADQINLVFSEDRKCTTADKKKTAREMRKLKAAKLKEAFKKDDFPTLLSHTELVIKQFKARKLEEESAEVKNPPPSPATDGRDNSSDGEEHQFNSSNDVSGTSKARELTAYDDDIFGGIEDHMDVA